MDLKASKRKGRDTPRVRGRPHTSAAPIKLPDKREGGGITQLKSKKEIDPSPSFSTQSLRSHSEKFKKKNWM